MGGDSWMDIASLFTKYVACLSAFDFFVGYNLLHLKVEMSASCCTEKMGFFFFSLGLHSLQNFQESPGTVTGVLKAETGLSGAIFVTVCCHPSTPGLWWIS